MNPKVSSAPMWVGSLGLCGLLLWDAVNHPVVSVCQGYQCEDPDDEDGGGVRDPVGYSICCQGRDAGDGITVTVSADMKSVTLSGARPGAKVSFACAEGDGGPKCTAWYAQGDGGGM